MIIDISSPTQDCAVELKANVTIDEGFDAYGTHKSLIFEGDHLVTKTSFNAQPLVEEAAAMRNATAGEKWGDMRRVATIPMAIYAKAIQIKDNRERQKYIKTYLRENPAFVTFDRYLK